MQMPILLAVLAILTLIGYRMGRSRSVAVAQPLGGVSKLHSLPSYYGAWTAIWCGVPALLVLGLWLAFEPAVITHLVVGGLPDEVRSLPPERLNLVLNDVRNLVGGNIVSREVDPAMQAAADHYRHLQGIGNAALAVVVLALAILGGAWAYRRINPEQRARNGVESVLKVF